MEKKAWHPVTYSVELKDKPLSVTLCEEAIVLWRDENGTPTAAKDLCVHRGVALSLGTICGGEIVCPYHGWRYRKNGECSHIPQLEDQTKIPAKAKIKSYQCAERYGLIWVALEEPLFKLAEIPEFENQEWKIVETGPFQWKSGSARQVENFTDFAHFPFVHPELLGDPERTFVPPHTVTRKDNVLFYEIIRPEASNTEEFPIFGNPTQEKPMRHNRYQLYLPYTIVLRVGWPGTTNGMVYVFVSQPVKKNECIGYCIIAKNYGDDDPQILKDFEDIIFGQDKFVVESQRPEQVPFDLSDELHLKFDAVAVAYRKAMKEMGFE